MTRRPHAPEITGICKVPDAPDYAEQVTITADVTDYLGVDEALLSYSYESVWHNVTLNRSGIRFSAEIPAQPYDTLVSYKIYANDTYGLWAESELFSYLVLDDVKPDIAPSRNPVQPRAGQNVKVIADVIEPTYASGVKTASCYYRVNSGS